jgi:hypothetical protein
VLKTLPGPGGEVCKYSQHMKRANFYSLFQFSSNSKKNSPSNNSRAIQDVNVSRIFYFPSCHKMQTMFLKLLYLTTYNARSYIYIYIYIFLYLSDR